MVLDLSMVTPLWYQAVQQAVEPFNLSTIVFAFAGVAALYLINRSVKNDGTLRDLVKDFRAHVRAETEWQQGISRKQEEAEERHAGNYANLLRVFGETKDAMMRAVVGNNGGEHDEPTERRKRPR